MVLARVLGQIEELEQWTILVTSLMGVMLNHYDDELHNSNSSSSV